MSVLTRKILPPFFGIATIGWIIGGTIWFDEQLNYNNAHVFSNTSSFNSSVATKINILPRDICFNSGSDIPIFYNENLVYLHKTADFLVKNNRHSLVLTGLSDVREQAVNNSINLGFARAEAIKMTLTNFGAPNNSLEIMGKQRVNLIDNNNQVCDAVKMTLVENTEGAHFQALNLFFKPNKFRFTETAELQTYFNDLQIFLQKNQTAQLKIVAFCSDTEGSKMAKNRLAFMADFLKNKKFNSTQFIFDNKKIMGTSPTIADAQSLTNQRIEIRILTP